MAGNELPGANPQLLGDMSSLGTGFFFSFNDNSQGNWVFRGRSSSNRHILEGRGRKKGPAPQAEVNKANSKLLGDSDSLAPAAIPPPQELEGKEAETSW